MAKPGHCKTIPVVSVLSIKAFLVRFPSGLHGHLLYPPLHHKLWTVRTDFVPFHHHHHHLRVVLSLLSLWRNPYLDSFHWCLPWANLVQVVPRCRLRSSLHLIFGLPPGLNHLRGTQDVALMVHLLSWSLATWPAHRCFDCLMWSMMSVTPVCCRIQVLCLWSHTEKQL